MDRAIGLHTNLIENSIESIIEAILPTVCTEQCDVRYAYYGDANEFWSEKDGVTKLPIETYTLPLSRCTTLLLNNLISSLIQSERFRKWSTDDIIVYFRGCVLKGEHIEIRLGIGHHCVRNEEDEYAD